MIEPAHREEEQRMPDERRHESADLEDYETEDASDTLAGAVLGLVLGQIAKRVLGR